MENIIWKDIAEFDDKLKDRLKKSVTILHEGASEVFDFEKYNVILVVSSDNMFDIHYVYSGINYNDKLNAIYRSTIPQKQTLWHMAEAVFDENGHILKNRYGIRDDNRNDTKIMDTKSLEEITKMFN